MLIDLKTIGKLVESILRSEVETRDDDTLLIFRVWEHQGFKIPDDLQRKIIAYGTKPEAIRRTRQKIQEEGRFQGRNRNARMKESELISGWAKGDPEF